MSKMLIVLLATLFLLELTGCFPKAEDLSLKPTVPSPVTGAGTEAWQQKWDSILNEAKKEGSLTLYGSIGTDMRQVLGQAFQNKYGIVLEYSSFNRSADLVVKVQAENRAGLYMADVFMTGGSHLLAALRPAGLMRPVAPYLLLPEILDPKAWRHGEVFYLDKEKLIIPLLMSLQRGVVFRNKELVKEKEIASVEDVLKPQYKGRIAMGDARVGGAGIGFLGMLGYHAWNKDTEKTKDFLRGLLRQEVVLTTNDQLLVEWVARGRYHIGLAASHTRLSKFMEVGAPVAPVILNEGVAIIAGSESVSLPVRSPHPNAATVFINWLLTKDGMTALSQATGLPTNRLDVSREGINPLFLPQPGEKVYDDSEDFINFRSMVAQELAIEVFGRPR